MTGIRGDGCRAGDHTHREELMLICYQSGQHVSWMLSLRRTNFSETSLWVDNLQRCASPSQVGGEYPVTVEKKDLYWIILTSWKEKADKEQITKETLHFLSLLHKYAALWVPVAKLFKAVGTVWHMEPAEELHKGFALFSPLHVLGCELKDQNNGMCPSHMSQFCFCCHLAGSTLRNQASLTSLTVYKDRQMLKTTVFINRSNAKVYINN